MAVPLQWFPGTLDIPAQTHGPASGEGCSTRPAPDEVSALDAGSLAAAAATGAHGGNGVAAAVRAACAQAARSEEQGVAGQQAGLGEQHHRDARDAEG
ncbi:hypothetical protein [Streptomyces sp. NPDC091416]|uniref:hypothetical protein n=1 Tax=Streptomyces sp. NPDC091416 TaxID=3366003 RepID=UPI00382216B8